MHDLIIINREGNRFGVRVVREGDRYGLDDCLVYGPGERGERYQPADPLIEFYDMRFTDRFGERGQFVSRYYRSTLMERDGRFGLNLDGGVDEWSIDTEAMQQVYRLLAATYEAEMEQLREEMKR